MSNDQSDGYEQMRRIEDHYPAPSENGLDATRKAEAQFGAVGGGGVVDPQTASSPRHHWWQRKARD